MKINPKKETATTTKAATAFLKPQCCKRTIAGASRKLSKSARAIGIRTSRARYNATIAISNPAAVCRLNRLATTDFSDNFTASTPNFVVGCGGRRQKQHSGAIRITLGRFQQIREALRQLWLRLDHRWLREFNRHKLRGFLVAVLADPGKHCINFF